MKSYTQEEVKALIDENLRLIKKLTHSQECLEEETRLRKNAERSYNSLCERCIKLYITERDITPDTIFIQVTAPRFMTRDDFNNGVVQQIVTQCTAEREKKIFHDLNTDLFKPIE